MIALCRHVTSGLEYIIPGIYTLLYMMSLID